jgi:hypothetical protein
MSAGSGHGLDKLNAVAERIPELEALVSRDGHSLLDFHSRSDQALPPRREVADRIANVSLDCAPFDALLRADMHLAITDLEPETTSPP